MQSVVHEQIKRIVQETVPADRMYLFGSRARGEARSDSDFDILVVVDGTFELRQRMQLATLCRQRLAEHSIDADVLVKTSDEIEAYADKPGSIVHEALVSGVALWPSIICFHAQQAVEKTFKAYLIYYDIEPPRTHSLEILLGKIREVSSNVPDYELGDLTAFAVQSRYPDETYEPTSDDARRYIQLAEDVVSAIATTVLSSQ